MEDLHAQPAPRVAILDAGAQYGKVIDRRVRGLQFDSALLPLDTPAAELEDYGAIIISGGPESVYALGAPHCDPRIFEMDKAVLGICYGMQLMNQAAGGMVSKPERREDGPVTISVEPASLLFDGLEPQQDVLMSHGDSVTGVARGFSVIARSGEIVAGIANQQRKLYGVQFHPEVDLTPNGTRMIGNFLTKVAGLEGNYSLADREAEAIRHIQEVVGERQVLVFVSGGVDSTVCAMLLAKALPGERINAVHVDTGFMRLHESDAVEQALIQAGIHLKVVRAEELFMNATTTVGGKQTPPLKQVTDPEVKRAIIGDTFMTVLEQTLGDLQLDPKETVLAQGTLRPDLIESASHLASNTAAVIKTHHNDTPLVRELRAAGRVAEPLSGLHKDEVRELGERLGLARELVWRQPFPGPGLAIRIICAEHPYKTAEFTQVAHSLEQFDSSTLSTCLLPIKTVGVQGDGRTYSYAAGLSGDADWPRLMHLAREIPKAVHGVNRVAYIFGDPVHGAVEDITPTHLAHEELSQLRQADDAITQIMLKHSLTETLKQVPVILFPAAFGQPGARSVAIRTFITNDWMTGVPAVPGVDFPEPVLSEMVAAVLRVPGIARVAYDLTSKPPGTTEWE